jgi:hypothetical protein
MFRGVVVAVAMVLSAGASAQCVGESYQDCMIRMARDAQMGRDVEAFQRGIEADRQVRAIERLTREVERLREDQDFNARWRREPEWKPGAWRAY